MPVCVTQPLLRNEPLNDQYKVLSVQAPDLIEDCQPGMFFEIKAALAEQERRLYKPISIYGVEDGEIFFLYKIVGGGTAALSTLQAGDLLKLIGPLGKGFPQVEGKNVLLVSGGIGYPPLAYLRKTLAPTNRIVFLHGGNCSKDVFPCDQTYTVDGSHGKKGMVTTEVQKIINDQRIDVVYSCGPVPMLKALAEIVAPLEHYVSLEAYMACGIGVCHGCAVPVGEGYQHVCVDGPVFNASEIRWCDL